MKQKEKIKVKETKKIWLEFGMHVHVFGELQIFIQFSYFLFEAKKITTVTKRIKPVNRQTRNESGKQPDDSLSTKLKLKLKLKRWSPLNSPNLNVWKADLRRIQKLA